MLILDSSFNPPTKAHAELVNAAICSYPPEFFDTALLLFSTNNADKQLSGASVVQRVQMMELLSTTLDQPAVIGLTRHGKFIDKATHITRWFDTKYNKTKSLELYFIVGYDTMIRFMDPKYYAPVSVKEALSPFFEQCHLICADRPHDDDKALFWKKTLEMFGSDRVKQIELHPTTASISSTKVRMDAEHTDMVNDAILAFIKASDLYNKE
jgi:nicotinamide-nucleotide adenylyltransferase